MCEEVREERACLERLEAATEAGEVREAEEDLPEQVVVEVTYGGGSGWYGVFRRRRRRRRRVGSHGWLAAEETETYPRLEEG